MDFDRRRNTWLELSLRTARIQNHTIEVKFSALMAPTVERREHLRRVSPSHSPRRRKERSSLVRSASAHRIKSPARDEDRPPKRTRPRSPPKNTSPNSLSPRTRRLRRAQAERDMWDREERDKGRHRERGEGRDVLSDKNGDGSSRSSRRERSISPEERSPRRRYNNSHSPPRSSKAGARHEPTKSGSADEKLRDEDHDSIAKMKSAEEALEAKKQKPSFELSGKLAEETNRVRGVTLLFTEPPDARKPDIRWRLYVFKAGEALNEPLYVHRQSCYLFGRERRVADIPTDHLSCSKQHAVIQFRLTEKEQPNGLLSKQVRPYIMDLGSTNGTFVNENRIESQRYYELFEKDTVKFGNSSREYVILHENSAT